ncbi:MAG: ABC transporter permease, partial [Gammaproteobacteria bacterium]
MRGLSLALRLFWRDWRGGELGMLLAAIALAVGIVSAIGLFVDRLQRAVELRGATFLAGELVLRARSPVPADWIDAARAKGLQTAEVLQFATMAVAGDAMQLAAVKAVGGGYPLLGELGVAPRAGAPSAPTRQGPVPGEVWADVRLLQALGVRVGARIGIGNVELRVAGVLVS